MNHMYCLSCEGLVNTNHESLVLQSGFKIIDKVVYSVCICRRDSYVVNVEKVGSEVATESQGHL